MKISVELDEKTAKALTWLKKHLNTDESTIISRAIMLYYYPLKVMVVVHRLAKDVVEGKISIDIAAETVYRLLKKYRSSIFIPMNIFTQVLTDPQTALTEVEILSKAIQGFFPKKKKEKENE